MGDSQWEVPLHSRPSTQMEREFAKERTVPGLISVKVQGARLATDRNQLQ